jgi:hypothetical protein
MKHPSIFEIEFSLLHRDIQIPYPMYLNTIIVLNDDNSMTHIKDCPNLKLHFQNSASRINQNILLDEMIVSRLEYVGDLEDHVKLKFFGRTVDQSIKDLAKKLHDPMMFCKNVMDGLVAKLCVAKDVDFDIAKMVSSAKGECRELHLDREGLLESNRIEEEEHIVDVPNGINIVAPCCGDFFEQDVRISFNGATLEKNIDYELCDIRINRMLSIGSSKSVFGFVKIQANIKGSVFISYRAVGGDNYKSTTDFLIRAHKDHEKRISKLEKKVSILVGDTEYVE